MEENNLLIYSQNIKNKATKILKEYKILECIKKCEKKLIVGSYALDLMIPKDIDIVVESKNIKKLSLDTLIKFIKCEKYSKVEYGDFIKFPKENRPKGCIINLHLFYENEKWEVEIWFLNDIKNYEIELKSFQEKINFNLKKDILFKKIERNKLGLNKNQLSSYEIYKKILNKSNEI